MVLRIDGIEADISVACSDGCRFMVECVMSWPRRDVLRGGGNDIGRLGTRR